MVVPFPTPEVKKARFAPKWKIPQNDIVQKAFRFQPMALNGLRRKVFLIQKKMITVVHLLDVHQIEPLYQFGGQQKG